MQEICADLGLTIAFVAAVLSSVSAEQLQPDDLEYTFSPSLDVMAAWNITVSPTAPVQFAVGVTTPQQTYTAYTSNSSLVVQLKTPNSTASFMVHPYIQLEGVTGRIWGAAVTVTSAPMACPPGWGIDSSNAMCAPCPVGTFNSNWLAWTVESACEICPSYSWSTNIGASFCFRAVANWAFNPLYTYNDTSDHGYDGVALGSLTMSTQAWRFGGGSLASSGDQLAFVQLPRFDFFCSHTMNCTLEVQNSWTVAFWFMPSVAANHGILSDWTPGFERLYARFFPNGTFEWTMRGRQQSTYASLRCADAAHIGVWNHVSVVMNQFVAPGVAQLIVYVNGSVACQTTVDAAVRIEISSDPFWNLGTAPSASGFTGWLDEVWIMDGALSPELVMLLVNSNTLLPDVIDDIDSATAPTTKVPFDWTLVQSRCEIPSSGVTPSSWNIFLAEQGSDRQLYPNILDQRATCNSCWAMASVTAAEIMQFYHDSQLSDPIYSVQQVLDCAAFGSTCKVPQLLMIDKAFSYISDQTQLCSDSAYPYDATISPTLCDHAQDCNTKVPFGNFDYMRMPLWENDFEKAPPEKLQLWDEQLKQVLFYCRSPVSVAIFYDSRMFQAATKRTMVYQSYGTPPKKCRQRSTPQERRAMGHAMTVVGWTEDYWILQNSYGPVLWALDVAGYPYRGFLRLERFTNTCGMFSKDAAYFFLPPAASRTD
jgi:hypothetical protein